MNIIIVTGRSRNIGNFYDNIINPIKGYFKDKNINFETIHFADQVRKDENPNNLYIGIFHHVDLHNMPKNYIMLAMDPPSNCNNTMKQKLKNANKILVYTDFEYFKYVNKNSIYYPFPYHTSIENMYNLDKNKISKIYDLIIIGTLNDKRVNIYNLLKLNNYNIYCPNIKKHPRGIFEREQDKLLYSSKIVLLNNYYKNDIQYPRMIYNSVNKIFFIYILNDDDNENLLDAVYNNLLVTCNSKNMFDVINYYLENEDNRIENVNILYDYVKNNLNVNLYLNI
jgi:hypothetical protein